MITGHPSEIELQEYAWNRSSCGKENIEHVEACESCRAEAAAYRLLFDGIKEQPTPSFDADLSGLVLSQLPGALPATRPDPHPGRPAGQISFGQSGIPRFSLTALLLTLLSSSTILVSLYLFRKNIRNMFGGISFNFMYVILAAAAIVVLYRMMGMYRKYQRQMEALNF